MSEESSQSTGPYREAREDLTDSILPEDAEVLPAEHQNLPSPQPTSGQEDALRVYAEGTVPLKRVPHPLCQDCGELLTEKADLEPLRRILCPHCGSRQIIQAEMDHYVIQRLLGIGGMSETFQALDKSLQRNVAVKLISELHAEDQQSVKGMFDEAQRAATLVHPNIVPIHAIGSVDGRPFIVMELLTDELFANPILARQPLNERFVLETGLSISKALQKAATADIMHRDVKPNNILHDQFGVAKLIDFGMACQVGDDVTGKWGTSLYMAPERLMAGDLDLRSDQYSLGIALWQALAGRPPYEADSIGALLYKVFNEPMPLLKSCQPNVQDSTADLIQKMVAFNPDDRFADYAELINALERALVNLPSVEGTADR